MNNSKSNTAQLYERVLHAKQGAKLHIIV